MSTNRNKELDKAETRRLILNRNRPAYPGGMNWLGHGGQGGKDAVIDYLLLNGATMERLLQERGTEASIRSHFQSLKTDHDLPVTRDANDHYKFDREHLGIVDAVSPESVSSTNRDYEKGKTVDLPPPSPAESRPLPQPTFEMGRIYNRRQDIHSRFGGQQQGGICTPARHPFVFLFTGPSGEQHGYHDGWDENGVFLYTGEGQSGDMKFVKGNLAIRDHAAAGRDLHIFESLRKGEGYRYIGQFDCVGWNYRQAPDSSGRERRAIVFQLMPENENAGDPVTGQQIDSVASAPLEELRRRALAGVRPKGEQQPRDARRAYYERSAAVRTYVLVRAVGVCEACRREAPFRRADGSPYLEPHHTRRVSDGGPDHPRWVGAICPNCHREIHHGELGATVNDRLVAYLGTIEAGNAG